MEDSWRFLKKLGIKPSIPLLGIHPKETKIKKDTCIPLFIAALFTIARTWKQPRCHLTDEWIKKLWYIRTMEYYSAINRNIFESVLKRWMNLDPMIQSPCLSFLSHTANSPWLSILHIVIQVSMIFCCSFHTSHPLLPSPNAHKSILYVCFSIAIL